MSRIVFRKVRWKNIMSYGNMWTEIYLDRNPSTMILGTNGAGKSTFTDVLMFGMFGKPFRKIKKGQLINTKNGRDAVVEIYFDCDGDEYLIRRGMKPDIFEVIKNDELLNQEASSRDYQKILENTILKMDYESACQIVCVGKAQHQPFMQLDSSKRRKFVEVILNLVVFSNMSKLHYNQTYEIKNKLQDLRSAVTVSKEKVKIRQRYIDDLESADRQNQMEELERIEVQLVKLRGQIDEINRRRTELGEANPIDDKAMEKAKSDLQQHIRLLTQMDTKIGEITKQLKSLNENTNCYACHQPLDPIKIDSQKDELQTKSIQLEGAKMDLSEQIKKLERIVDDFQREYQVYYEHRSKLSDLDSEARSIRNRIADLEEEKSRERTSNAEKIQEAKAELAGMEDIYIRLADKLQEVQERADYLQVIGTILQDKGIKSMMIKRFVPIINATVNKHLAHLGLFAKFSLDENFDETIQSRGFDTLGYNSFSEGEKLRMDMALLMAWRDIAKMQGNVSTNLLVFDEVFDSSLDGNGAEALAEMLTQMEGLNVFIITHAPEKIMDKVRSVIRIDRVDGYSKLVS